MLFDYNLFIVHSVISYGHCLVKNKRLGFCLTGLFFVESLF